MVEAVDWEGPSYQTCMNVAVVCKAFETYRRREVLSFTHHAEVAALHPNEADPLLDFAEETIASTGRPRSVAKMREERWKRHHAAEAVEDAGVRGSVAIEENDRRPIASGAAFSPPLDLTPNFNRTTPDDTGQEAVADTVHWLKPRGTQTDGDDQAIAMVMDVVKRATALPISNAMRSKLENIRLLLGPAPPSIN